MARQKQTVHKVQMTDGKRSHDKPVNRMRENYACSWYEIIVNFMY